MLPSFVDDLRFDWVFVVLDDVVLNPGFDLPRLASQAEELLQGGGAAGCEESKVGCA